jgi:hypothetical protein
MLNNFFSHFQLRGQFWAIFRSQILLEFNLNLAFDPKSVHPMPRYKNFLAKTPKKNSNLLNENAHIYTLE